MRGPRCPAQRGETPSLSPVSMTSALRLSQLFFTELSKCPAIPSLPPAPTTLLRRKLWAHSKMTALLFLLIETGGDFSPLSALRTWWAPGKSHGSVRVPLGRAPRGSSPPASPHGACSNVGSALLSGRSPWLRPRRLLHPRVISAGTLCAPCSGFWVMFGPVTSAL